jgi:hypothetical protein
MGEDQSKPIRSSQINKESMTPKKSKPQKKIIVVDNGDPILGFNKKDEEPSKPKKLSSLTYLRSNTESEGPLFAPCTETPEP